MANRTFLKVVIVAVAVILGAGGGVKIVAVPTVIILDPQGRFLNSGHPTALSNARAMKPQAIVDTIFGWLTAAN